MPRPTIRDATRQDIRDLIALEMLVFASDRLTPAGFRRLVRGPTAICRVVRRDRQLAGYSLVLLRSNSAVARLYSLAVHPDFRGEGLAAALVRDAERQAFRHGRRALRLEVREDNHGAIRLYERLGYRRFGHRPGYYADGAGAFRYERRLAGAASRRVLADST